VRFKPSPALIVSIVAVVIVSAGSATAATMVTSKQIKNGTITSKDIRNRSVTSVDLKAGTVGTRQLTAATVTELQATVATTQVTTSEPIVAVSNGTDYAPHSAVAMCPEGQVALGGGGAYSTRMEHTSIGLNRPVMDAAGKARGWEVGGRPSDTDGSQRLEVYAICSP
jgi:hypothetical protein